MSFPEFVENVERWATLFVRLIEACAQILKATARLGRAVAVLLVSLFALASSIDPHTLFSLAARFLSYMLRTF